MARWLRWLAVLTILSGLPVLAASDVEKEAATRFQRGVGLYKDGDFEAALSEFKQAYRLAPFYEVLYNIGLTQRRLYQYGAAVKSLNDYLSEGAKKVTPARRELVRKELEEIRALTASVTVKVSGTDGATILVDNEEVGKAPLKEPLLLRPGKHTITATRTDETASETISLLTGSEVTVKLEPQLAQGKLIINSDPPNAQVSVDGTQQGETPVIVVVAVGSHTILADRDGYATATMEAAVTPGQARTVTVKLTPGGNSETGSSSGRRVPVVGILVSAGGLGLLAGAVVFNLQAQGAAQQMTQLFSAGTGTYDRSAQAIEAKGHTASALSWTMGLVGGAALITGVILVLADVLSNREPEVSFFFAPTGQGFGAGATWRMPW